MIAQEMVDRSVSVRQIALQLGVDESTLRYRLGRPLDAPDGRTRRVSALAEWDERIDAVFTRLREARLVPDGTGHVITPAFQTFARACGFSVDPCRARARSDKGKVERAVRTGRGAFDDLFVQDWATIEVFQRALDRRATGLHTQRRCPMTGTTIAEALAAEQPLLQAPPPAHEPFDCVVARRVTRDSSGRRPTCCFSAHRASARATSRRPSG